MTVHDGVLGLIELIDTHYDEQYPVTHFVVLFPAENKEAFTCRRILLRTTGCVQLKFLALVRIASGV